jgi:carbon-monoxide dehydrogenase small subunit
MKQLVHLTVNGLEHDLAVAPHRTLVEVLREDLGLTGTKLGCGEGDCGACTVLLDGRAVNSCLVLAVQADGRQVTTIEGLAGGRALHPIQRAFIEEGAIQCGFCIPGMIMASEELLAREPCPTREQIREGLSGNLCRCTGYEKIFRAVEKAAYSRTIEKK